MEILNSRTRRGRPRLLSDVLKRAIEIRYNNKPQWSAKKILDNIRRKLFDYYKLNHPNWTDEKINAQIKLPGINSIQRYIREELKPNESKPQYLDQPWSLGLMAEKKLEYRIPPEAVPYVLVVQSWAENYPDDVFKKPHAPLTIRQALWVARLYGTITPKAMEKAQKNVRMRYSIGHYLYQWSEAYATRERICKMTRTPFDTKNLDRLLGTMGEPITGNKTTVIFFREGMSFEIDTIDEELLNQMERMKKGR